MAATPAEVANDLAAQANFFYRRDEDVARACRDGADVIRAMLADERVDGRTYAELHQRLTNLVARYARCPETVIARSIARGLRTLQELTAARMREQT